MHNTMDLFRLLPQLDCGACGNSVCVTLSRRIAAGWQKPEECRYISKTNLGRIYELLDEGVEVGPENVPVGHIIEIQPCAQYGKVTLEAQLSRPSESIFDVFDSCELCTSLGDVGLLKNVRCSLEMGYSIAEHNETRIHIFKTGKIVMRRASDRDQALDTLNIIQRSLWGAVVCPYGNSAIECVTKGCCIHNMQISPGITWGITADSYEKTRGIQIHSRVKALETAKMFVLSMKKLNLVIDFLKKLSNTAQPNNSIENEAYGEQIKGLIREASAFAIEFIVTTKREEDAALGLILRALIRCLGRITDGIISYNHDESTTKLFRLATQIVFNSYQLFNQGEDSNIGDLEKDIESFQMQWNESRGDTNLIKVATNGFSIARLNTGILPK